jgi:uncharacterized HAD superfamily protein
MREKGDRYNEGKLRLDLITPQMMKGLGRVLTHGTRKYSDRNWEIGLEWTGVAASLKRHLLAFEEGEDYDSESGLLHIEHVLANAGFLATYYETRPEYDDRIKRRFKIALDIDGVLADFKGAYCKRHNIQPKNNHWHFTYLWKQEDGLFEDKDFWTNKIQPLVDGTNLSIEPVCYVTSRRCSVEWTKEWLEKHGFPCEPVYTNQASKVEVLKEMFERGEVDIFVDDAYKHFVELNNAGIPTYLFDRPYNRKYDVGYKRIYDLRELA